MRDEVLRQWPEAKKMTMAAFEGGDSAKWEQAFFKCRDFRKDLKVRLERGDQAAQALNRDKVLPLGMML